MSQVVSQNIFEALGKKKKKSSKPSKNEEKAAPPKADKTAELEKALFSQPIGLSSWADESDEEEDHHAAPSGDGWNAVGWPGRLACHNRIIILCRDRL